MRIAGKEKSLFSRRLIELRKQKGLTQQELASKLNIDRHQVAYYETKAKNPTAETLQLLADFFTVSPDFFLLDDELIKSKPGPNSQLEQRINQLKRLPRSQQKTVLAMIDGVLASFQKS